MDDIGSPRKVTDRSGGNGLWSTPTDYIKILTDLFKNEPTVLKRKTVEDLMFAPQITYESALRGLANVAPSEEGIWPERNAIDQGIGYFA